MATERSSVATAATGLSLQRLHLLGEARRREEGAKVRGKTLLDAGAQDLHRYRAQPPVGIAHCPRCTWAIEAAATGGPKLSNSTSAGMPNCEAISARARSMAVAACGPGAF